MEILLDILIFYNCNYCLLILVDTGRKLNVHKTFRRRPGRPLNVLCTFNLRPVSTGIWQSCSPAQSKKMKKLQKHANYKKVHVTVQ